MAIETSDIEKISVQIYIEILILKKEEAKVGGVEFLKDRTLWADRGWTENKIRETRIQEKEKKTVQPREENGNWKREGGRENQAVDIGSPGPELLVSVGENTSRRENFFSPCECFPFSRG